MRRTLRCLALIQALGVIAVPAARGDEADPAARKAEARRHFEKGTLRFDEGRFREAISHFEAAYEVTGAPEILYNIGRCHEELGQTAAAVSHYERYLERQGDAADAAEVRERIDRLKPADTAPAGEPGQRDAKAAPGGVMLGVTLGAAFPIVGEWDRTMVPFSAVLHLPLVDWLYLTGSAGYAGFAGEEPKVETGYPTGAVDLTIGLTGFKSLNDLFSLFGGIGLGNVFLLRDRHSVAYWLDPRLAIGLAVRFFESWSATAEATGSYGPVFNASRTRFDPWDPPGPTADAGGRLGVFYSF
jgi:tetratricopeptide (TPR) repeat protein